MRFQCSHCGGILAIEDCEPGEAVACGHCGSPVAVPDTPLSPGAVIGDFVLGEELGAGGMGAVYYAHQVSLDRAAALKILHGRFTSDTSYIRDFVREARSAAALNHPNIVQAYAVGDDGDIYYFAMEYVPGSTVKQVLSQSGRIVSERVLDIALQVASALDFGWQHQQLIHRDIKPDNIILTTDGSVKLADLGLARRLSDAAADGTRELYGTPQYIAPEQILGFIGDNRSDIYSLGATLFHALTGQFPYPGDGPGDSCQRHLSDPLPVLADVCPDVNRELAKIVTIMLAKRPWHRYSTAAELLVDLKAVKEGGVASHRAAATAQDPIDINSEDAVNLAEGTQPGDLLLAETAAVPAAKPPRKGGGRRLVVPGSRKTLQRRAAATGDSASALPGEASAAASPPGNRPAETPVPARTGSRRALIALVAVVALFLIGFSAMRVMTASQESRPHAASGITAAAAAADIEAMIAAGQSDDQVQVALNHFAETYGDEPAARADFLRLAAPFRETDLDRERRALQAEERKAWGVRSQRLKDAEEAREAERLQAAEAEAERQREQEADQQLAEDTIKQQAELLAERERLRWQAVALCREQRYSEALTLFVPLAVSNDPESRAWAQSKQRCIELTKELLDSIINSKTELAGCVLPVPRQRGEWKVVRIGFKGVDIERRRTVYRKGKRSEEVQTAEILLGDLTPVQIDLLTRRKWELDGKVEGERQVLVGAYLLARAQFLPEARKRLENSGSRDAEAMLEELALLAPGLRQFEFTRTMETMESLVERGDIPRAKAAARYLRRTFPAETEANQERIDALIPPD